MRRFAALLFLVPTVSSLRVLPDSGQQRAPSLAILISGLKSRLVFKSTLQRVVYPAARAGGAIDLYISLVAAPGEVFHSWQGSVSPRVEGKETAAALRANLSRAARNVGGRLAWFRQLEEQEELDELPNGNFSRRYMWEYAPRKSEVGRNVLRRWKSAQELFNKALTSYDFVLWQREDQYWTHPLSLAEYNVSPNTVFAKNCLAWGGINDKSLLMGSRAAQQILSAYSAFWSEDERLVSRNAEQFLEALAEIKNVSIVKVPYKRLPSADATYVPGAIPQTLCIKHGKSCERRLPKGEPAFCPDGGNTSSDVERSQAASGRCWSVLAAVLILASCF